MLVVVAKRDGRPDLVGAPIHDFARNFGLRHGWSAVVREREGAARLVTVSPYTPSMGSKPQPFGRLMLPSAPPGSIAPSRHNSLNSPAYRFQFAT